ncbi:MAG: DUF3135 domain-containing protein [Desulfobulbaceae bacterium]|nr:DUF3135 domain-containing protein [Desulfobulbaceae bacterium]
MNLKDNRIRQSLNEHRRLAELLQKNAKIFEEKRKDMIKDFIEFQQDSDLREKLKAMQKALDRVF